MVWDILLLSIALFVLAMVARKLTAHVWFGETDPFGRRCKNRGGIDHPEYRTLKAQHPSTSFLQIDVALLDLGETTTVHILLKSPSAAEEEKHLGYYQAAGIALQPSPKCVVESIVRPWEERGYVAVAGALRRSCV